MHPKNIAIISGGFSGEYQISIDSGKVIAQNIDKELFTPWPIVITETSWYHETKDGRKYEVDRNDFSLDLPEGKIIFSAVFNIIHGSPGEDGQIQGYFDMLDIPYSCSGRLTSALTFSKSYCNQFVGSTGIIKIADAVLVKKYSDYNIDEIIDQTGLPCFVKPNNGGSSVGMSKVTERDLLASAIERARKEDDHVLIESFVEGREITCGVFMNQAKMTVLPLTEIVSKKAYFDYEAKYTEGMADEITPAPIETKMEEEIKRISASLYKILDCKGVVRFDYIIGKEELFFLEVNTIPGMSEKSIVPKMINMFGTSMKDFITILLQEAMLIS